MPEKQPQSDAQKADSMEKLILEDGRYPLDAYAFLHEALARAVKQIYGDKARQRGERHVTGQQLCQALRELAVEQWGMLAATVLRRWNVRATIDFGNMVFLLVTNGFMQKTEQDALDDFRDVYDFQLAFRVEPNFDLKE